jgi:acetylornithine/succinyldiaminopimelate/putrescine aminotransferase/predicted amino acid dehydrogenase
MKFAFLVHPLTEETQQLTDMNWGNTESVSQDLIGLVQRLHRAVYALRHGEGAGPGGVRVVDELAGLVSAAGAKCEGRLYEIPMDAYAILDDTGRALEYMEQAVDMAAEWGAKIVGLGSMTGIVGGQGAYLAERAAVPVTTGNSLTVYAAVENLAYACFEAGLDLGQETVVVVGIPGSIATAAARVLASRCRSLVLVARRASTRASRIADKLDAELLLDIPEALRRARVVFSATSSGSCIEQGWLQPGTLVVDVAVPTDVEGVAAEREDVLLLTGGLSKVPRTMSMDSTYLWFHHGMVPSCLAETCVLGLEDRTECFSLGRDLDPGRIEEIGQLARAHGFSFSHLYSFGVPLDDSALVRYRKSLARKALKSDNHRPRSAGPGHEWGTAAPPRDEMAPERRKMCPTPEDLSPRARDLYRRYINPVLMALGGGNGFVKTFVRGEGTRLWDADGHGYLDFVAGYGSLNLGHNHPAVIEAIQTAIRESAPGFSPAAVNPYAAALAERLATLSPPGLEITFFANSGTEAVEAALKIARKATGRTGFVHCERSYHGKTLGSLSVTGNPVYQKPFAPLVPDCVAVPYGDLELLERRLSERRFAAFIVEPIQGEGGMVVPPEGYLREAARLCRQTGTLLVVDEVQTGLGRTGSTFAVDRLEVEPDVLTLAKSLSGGLVPIGAMLARRDLWLRAYGTIDAFALHTSTFSGGSLACAAGLAALEVLENEDLAANALARGRQIREGLGRLCARCEGLREVRGEGLMIGLEFTPLPDSIRSHMKGLGSGEAGRYLIPNLEGMLDAHIALYVMSALLEEHRIYTQTARSHPRVLRIQPPLTITADEVTQFLQAMGDSCLEADFANSLVDGTVAKSGLGQYAGKAENGQAPAAEPGRKLVK